MKENEPKDAGHCIFILRTHYQNTLIKNVERKQDNWWINKIARISGMVCSVRRQYTIKL